MHKGQSDIGVSEMYKILTGAVAPRPIAWVSTVSADGVPNLAPFSFYTIASVNPPVVCFAPNLKRVQVGEDFVGLPKDTLQNIYDTGEFVINSVRSDVGVKMVATGGNFAPEISEFNEAKVTPIASLIVSPPGVAEAFVRIECRLRQVISFGSHAGAGNLVLGDIAAVFVDDKVVDIHGELNPKIMRCLARLGGDNYCESSDVFEIAEVFDVAGGKGANGKHLSPFGI